MRAVLLCDVRSLSGGVYRAGEVVEVTIARDGVAEVAHAGYLPRNRWSASYCTTRRKTRERRDMATGPEKTRARYVAFARAVALAIAVAIVEALIQVFSGQDLPDQLQLWGPVIVAALRVIEGEIDDYRERAKK